MNYKDLVRFGWICVATFVIYCMWFVLHNYPCEDYTVTIPLMLALAILTPVLLLNKSPFVITGLNLGAIYGALFFMSSYVVLESPSQIHEDDAIEIVIDLSMGLIVGAIIGIFGGFTALWVNKGLGYIPYLQKGWVVILLLLFMSTLPWLYKMSWEAFGYRWVINDLVKEHGNELLEALTKYDNSSEFACNSIYIYSYTDNVVELWVAQREKSSAQADIWLVAYELRSKNGIWEVSEVYGGCGYECERCYNYRNSYVFHNF